MMEPSPRHWLQVRATVRKTLLVANLALATALGTRVGLGARLSP